VRDQIEKKRAHLFQAVAPGVLSTCVVRTASAEGVCWEAEIYAWKLVSLNQPKCVTLFATHNCRSWSKSKWNVGNYSERTENNTESPYKSISNILLASALQSPAAEAELDCCKGNHSHR